jgi:uncharacterized protein (TIGR00725 family)
MEQGAFALESKMLTICSTTGYLHQNGRILDPLSWTWIENGVAPVSPRPVSPREAVAWLSNRPGTRRRVVAVAGPRTGEPHQLAAATAVGQLIATMGCVVLCGGKGGVMDAVCRGVAEAGGFSIGLLPEPDDAEANAFVSVALPTGIGSARNTLIACGGVALVAIGGGPGTLSEIAFALHFGRPVLTLADAPMVPGILACDTPDDVVECLAAILLKVKTDNSHKS